MYSGVRRIFSTYWNAYGGFRALVRSPYLHFSIVLVALTWNTWWAPQCSANGCVAWWDQNLSVLPNVLGFTLGGFAIFIGFGDEKFRSVLADPSTDQSGQSSLPTMYVELCAAFVHFILVQALALVCAVVAKAWWFYSPLMDPVRDWLPLMNAFGGFVGYGLFVYALTCVVAATMHVFRIANLYSQFRRYADQGQSGAEARPQEQQMK